jgi:type II pantothenate kinase
MSKQGNHHNVDLLVGDIYGTEYSKVGLKSTTIASSVGKVFKQAPSKRKFKPEDLCQSLLYMISNNLGQLAFLNAQLHGCKRIFFTGSFIRGHPPTMSAITFAVQYWSQGRMESLFLRHEGYLGAIGAFVKHTPPTRMRAGSFAENFTLATDANVVPSIGSLEQLPIQLVRFPLLKEPYECDTFDMTPELTTAWIDLLQNSLHHLADLAAEWAGNPENKSRAAEFEVG